MSRLKTFTHGLVLSAAATLISLGVALWWFRKMYYFGAMLPVFMGFYLLLAWLMHLKRTSFNAFSAQTTAGRGAEISEDKMSGAEILGTRDESGLLPRRPTQKDNSVEGFLQNPIPALLWSACQLAVLATFLYSALGIGATYY